MRQTPSWVVRAVEGYAKITAPSYPHCLWRDVEKALAALASDECSNAWLKLERRLAGNSDGGRENFAMQICFDVACSLALPSVPPSEAKRTARKTLGAIGHLYAVLPSILPISSKIHDAADMRLASVGACIQGDKRLFNERLFLAMLDALRADVHTWELWNSRITRPDDEGASRLLFVRDATDTMVAYFDSPLRAIVADFSNAVFPSDPGIDAAAVAHLAPLNGKHRRRGSLHALNAAGT